MKIRLRFPVLLVFLLVLLTDRGFTQLLFEEPDDPLIAKYNYFLLGVSLVVCFLNLRYMSQLGRRWFWVVILALGGLALESYAGWGSWMIYPHVFSKLTVLLPMFAVYSYYSRVGPPSFTQISFVILAGLSLNLALFNQDALSLNAFLNNERGFSVTSAYLFLPVALLCLGWFLTSGRMLHAAVFFACMGMIVFLQHRTVWISALVSIPLFLLLLRRVPGARLTSSRVLILTLFPLLIATLGGLAAVLDNPQVIKKLTSSIEDIQHADKQGTGSWRMQQYDSYMPFVEERPVAGWRLDGFELPVQFYNEDTNTPIWDDFTGHHFHSFYLDRLFYFGALGVLLVLLVPIIMVINRLRKSDPLTPEMAALLACVANLIVYGFSYDWAPYQFSLIGLMLATLKAPAYAPAANSLIEPNSALSQQPAAHYPTVTEPALYPPQHHATV